MPNLSTISPLNATVSSLEFLKSDINLSQGIDNNLLQQISGDYQRTLFNSSLIDSYMHFLCDTQIHAVSSSWVSQRLFQSNNKPLDFLALEEKTKILWYDFSYVLIPVNVSNFHWVLYVFAVYDKILYFCDSMQGFYPAYNNQIIHYIALEHFRKFGCVLNYDSLRFCSYSANAEFPLQTVGHSCGPYVCMIAKAIIHALIFNFDARYARKTIALELIFHKLYLKP